MFAEMRNSIAEEFGEVETLRELQALWAFGQVNINEYADAECVPMFKDALRRLRSQPPVLQGVAVEVSVEETPADARIRELQLQIQRLKQQATVPVAAPAKSGRRYRLLDTNVSWATASQVHGIMEILKAHVPVGGTIAEEEIVAAMVANERTVLRTRQGGEKIWKYYRGKHDLGLEAHYNIEEVKA